MSKMLLVNPRTRKRKNPARSRKRRAPARRRRTNTAARRRSNPIKVNNVMENTIRPAAISAAGALSLDAAWGYVPLPEAFKAGPMRHVAKGAGAIGLGMLAEQVTTKKNAQQLATGAMTVVLHDMGREFLGQYLPGVPMGEYMGVNANPSLGYYSPGMPTGQAGAGGSLGMYLNQPAPPQPAGNGGNSNGDNTVEGYDPYSM